MNGSLTSDLTKLAPPTSNPLSTITDKSPTISTPPKAEVSTTTIKTYQCTIRLMGWDPDRLYLEYCTPSSGSNIVLNTPSTLRSYIISRVEAAGSTSYNEYWKVRQIQTIATDLNVITNYVKREELASEVVEKLDLFTAIGEIKDKKVAENQVTTLSSYLLFNQLLFYRKYQKKNTDSKLKELKEIEEVAASGNEKKLEIAQFMAERAIRYITAHYEEAAANPERAQKDTAPLKQNIEELSRMVREIPKMRFLKEKEREWEQQQITRKSESKRTNNLYFLSVNEKIAGRHLPAEGLVLTPSCCTSCQTSELTPEMGMGLEIVC